jgi:hypothetical protein
MIEIEDDAQADAFVHAVQKEGLHYIEVYDKERRDYIEGTDDLCGDIIEVKSARVYGRPRTRLAELTRKKEAS